MSKSVKTYGSKVMSKVWVRSYVKSSNGNAPVPTERLVDCAAFLSTSARLTDPLVECNYAKCSSDVGGLKDQGLHGSQGGGLAGVTYQIWNNTNVAVRNRCHMFTV